MSCVHAGVVRSSSSPDMAHSSSRRRASSAPRERPQSGPWRPSSPAKQGAAFCVLSHVGRNYVPDPVKEAAVSATGLLELMGSQKLSKAVRVTALLGKIHILISP